MADPHRDGRVYHFGAELAGAAGAMILLHGRGASAQDILSLAESVYRPGLAYFAPQAAGSSWYPNSFLAPREANEPWLSSALAKVEAIVASLEAAGLGRDRIVIGGFSQGACLSSEFVASHPARYAGVIAFTGGLVGPLGTDLTHPGSLAGTPVLLSSGDPDPHVPWSRVEETGDQLTAMGASVTLRRYPGRPHTVLPEELEFARRLGLEAFPE